MIRVALECLLVFLLPSVIYFGYVALMAPPADGARDPAHVWVTRLDAAPLGWLFAIGVICLVGALTVFATLQDDRIDQPYAPAIFKDGRIIRGERP